MKSALFSLLKTRRQFVLYCLIGTSGVTFDFLIYSLLINELRLNYQIANVAGYFSGTVLSFVLNARFNFKIRDWLAARFISFCGVAFLGWAVSAVILFTLVGEWQWNKYFAKLLTIAVIVLLQYNLNRLVSFKK
jgi:putative flippase GtrA